MTRWFKLLNFSEASLTTEVISETGFGVNWTRSRYEKKKFSPDTLEVGDSWNGKQRMLGLHIHSLSISDVPGSELNHKDTWWMILAASIFPCCHLWFLSCLLPPDISRMSAAAPGSLSALSGWRGRARNLSSPVCCFHQEIKSFPRNSSSDFAVGFFRQNWILRPPLAVWDSQEVAGKGPGSPPEPSPQPDLWHPGQSTGPWARNKVRWVVSGWQWIASAAPAAGMRPCYVFLIHLVKPTQLPGKESNAQGRGNLQGLILIEGQIEVRILVLKISSFF